MSQMRAYTSRKIKVAVRQMLLFTLFSVTLLSARASVVFEDCGSAFELERVNIEGCGRRLPCYVTLGEDLDVKIEFLADNRPFRLDQDVILNVNHLNLQTPVKPDPCSIRECPVSTDRVTSLASVMTVPRDVALNERGWLHWKVYSDTGRMVVCFSVMVETQSSLQRIIRDKIQQLLPNNTATDEHADVEHIQYYPRVAKIYNYINNNNINTDNNEV